MTCAITDCSRPSAHRGWCNAHYARWLRYGNPLAGTRFRREAGLSEEAAFRRIMAGEPPAEGCWDWPASLGGRGYGCFTLTAGGESRRVRAHRASYRIFNGPIPEGAHVLHSCNRKVCVHPSHLHLGSQADNIREAAEDGLIPLGTARANTRLTEADVVWIRESSLTGKAIAEILGVARSTVYGVRTGRTWKHV